MNVFDLFAKLSLDTSEYDKKLKEASDETSSFGDKLMSGLGTAAKVSGVALGAAATAATAAVTKLTTAAVDGYADYEQLEGGIETLFGTGGKNLEEFAKTAKATARDIENSGVDWKKYSDMAWASEGNGVQGLFDEIKYNVEDLKSSSDDIIDYLHFEYDLDVEDAKKALQSYYDATKEENVTAKFESMERAQELMMENAAKAYRTAGMSANEYMETSIQSAAALINSLGGDQEEAAKLMDMSIIDMSDNVNKMGTTMEAVQNAYRGFSRGNFSMLDNLALGFSGTKEGMEQLLAQAEAFSGVEYDIDSYADIVQAIHVVQEEMGVAGTTAKEANETISGSLSSMKGAWNNLVTGISSPNADIGLLVDEMVGSAETVLDNIVPAIERALNGIVKVIDKAGPIIAKKLPTILQKIIPTAITTITELTNALVEALPELIQLLIDQIPILFETLIPTFLELLPQVIELGLELITALATGIAQYLPDLVPTIIDIILEIVDTLTQPDNLLMLLDAAIAIILGLTEGIIKAMPKLIEKAPEIVGNLVEAIVKAVPKLWSAAKEIIANLIIGIKDNFGKLLNAGMDIVFKLIEGIMNFFADCVAIGADIGKKVKEGFWEFVEAAKQWGADLIKNFIDGLMQKWEDLKKSVTDIAGSIADILGFSEPKKGPLSNFHTYAPDMMDLFAKGIEDNKKTITDAINDSFNLEPTIKSAYADGKNSFVSSSDGNLVSAIVKALRQVAPELSKTIKIEGNRDRIVDVIVEENQKSIYSMGRGLLET